MIQDSVDAEIIDKLGGGRNLSYLLSNLTKYNLNEKTVYSWKQQGIPDKWKIAVAKLLVENKIDFPRSFLPPGMLTRSSARFQRFNTSAPTTTSTLVPTNSNQRPTEK